MHTNIKFCYSYVCNNIFSVPSWRTKRDAWRSPKNTITTTWWTWWWLPRRKCQLRHSRMSLWHSWLSFSLFSSSKSIMTFMTITVTVYRVMYMVDTNARTNNYGLTNSLNYIIVWKSCLVCNAISKTCITVEKNSAQACYEMLVSCTTYDANLIIGVLSRVRRFGMY